MKPEVKVFENIDSLNVAFTNWMREILWKKGQIAIALSGGSTPKALFDYWAKNYKTEIDWPKVYLFWGDERCVEPTDEESNFKMTKDHLLKHIPIPEKNIFRIHGEDDPYLEVNRYINVLENNVELKNHLPAFDILMLGLGEDGHTASIFPHQIELWDSNGICVVATHPDTGQKRISLSGKTINNAHHIAFLVTGGTKAEKVREIIQCDEKTANRYPASKVDPENGELIWFLDKKAAKLLD